MVQSDNETGDRLPAAAKISRKGRIHLMDEIRGLCVLLMIFYHAFYTMSMLFHWDLGTKLLVFFSPAEPFFAGLFILISGISSQLSHSNLIRGLKLLGVALALLCLCFVLPLLMAADDGFASLLSGFVGRLAAWFSGWRDSWTEFVVKVFFALPTALYLYGLVYGAVRGRRACVYDKKEVCAVQRGLRFAPRSTVLTALFVLCAVYLLFISMQAKYLFGAFWGALPEGFSYSEYARQGFFELCRVAAINIVILLAANVMSRAQAAENCLLRVCNTALSALTLLLLATAAAKMALYIAAYGLTVKRVLASVFLVWMACVFVCVILRQFRTVALVRVAVFLGAVLFALLCVLPVGDGISTYNAARVQVGTLDPDVMEQELRPLV